MAKRKARQRARRIGGGTATKPSKRKAIEQYDHADKKRANNPPVGLVTLGTDPPLTEKKTYDGFPNSGSPSALLRLASGNLLLVYNASRVARRPLSVVLSPDGGETWTPGRVIADGESSYSYPSAAQTPDGLIHVVFSEARRRIRHVTLNEEWVVRP